MSLVSKRIAKWPTESLVHLALTAIMTVYSYWLTSYRTWLPDQAQMKTGFSGTFYQNQAISMLHGRLTVPEFSYANECFYRDGKCFGYFGVFPSVVRFPFFLIARSTSISLIPVAVALAAGIALWSSLDILRHLLNSTRARTFSKTERHLILILGGILLGPGGSLVTQSQSKVYREAIIWMIAMVLLAFAMTIRWFATRNTRFLIIALAAGIGATNSRPSAIPIIVGLGIWIYFDQYKRESSLIIEIKSIPFAMIVLPAATSLFVVYLKFRAFAPPWSGWADYNGYGPTLIRSLNNGQMQGARFIPTNLVQYFRPDSVGYSLSNPWGKSLVTASKPAILVWPIRPSGILTEPTASIPNTMPIQLLLSGFAAGVVMCKKKIAKYISAKEFLPLFLTTLPAFLFPLIHYSSTSRYVGDFFPALVIGTIYGGIAISAWLGDRKLLKPALYCVFPVAIYFSLVQYSLNVGGWATIG